MNTCAENPWWAQAEVSLCSQEQPTAGVATSQRGGDVLGSSACNVSRCAFREGDERYQNVGHATGNIVCLLVIFGYVYECLSYLCVVLLLVSQSRESGVCQDVSMCACRLRTRTHTYTQSGTCVRVHTCTVTLTHLHTHTHARMHTHTHACMHTLT